MRGRSGRYWLLAILAAFVALQSLYFENRWGIDESWYLMPIPSIVHEGRFRIPTILGNDVFWPQPPLLTYAETLVDVVHPLTPATARLLPLAFGCLLIVATYLLGRRLYGEAVGVLAAAFVASDNLVFLAARTVRPEILVAFFVTSTLLVIATDTGHRGLALAGLFAGLGLSSHPNGLLAAGCGALLLLGRESPSRTGIRKVLELSFWTLLAALPFVVWLVVNDAPSGFAAFRHNWLGRYGRLVHETPSALGYVLALVRAEIGGRWASFVQAPYRVHVAILSLLVVGRALRNADPTLRALGAGCVLQLLFFIFVNNSVASVRYMTSLIPLVAILAAQWTYALWSTHPPRRLLDGPRWLAIVLVVGLGLSQVAGDGLYLWRARDADYPATVEALDALIPPGGRVYGSITFWLGLRKHDFVPYMHMPWARARSEHRVNVVILDDAVMADPRSRWGNLRKQLHRDLATEHWSLLGEVDSKYYGHMKVYAAP